MMLKLTALLLVLLTLNAPSASSAQTRPPRGVQAKVDRTKLAERARAEFLHAWRGYEKYAWGHDDLRPLSKTHHDWYEQPILMTPVDSLDTMILMGLHDEAKKTREFIVN